MPAPLGLPAALALAALSALLFYPGFTPLGAWPLTVVAFAPLYLALGGQPPRRAFALGWATMFVANLGGFSWLAATISTFGGLPAPVGVLLHVGLCAWNGCRLGLAAWLAARARDRGWPEAPAFIAAFLTLELTFPLVFPWYVATGADRALPLLQAAELGGPLAVDLLLLLPSVALGAAMRARREGRPLPRVGLAVGLTVPVVAAGVGWVRIEQVRATMAAAPPVRIGLVQPNSPAGSRGETESLQAATRLLKGQGAELVVWPEVAIRTSYNDLTYTQRVPEQVTGGLGVATLLGVGTWRLGATEHAPRIRHNAVLLAGADGAVLGRYDKHQLVPFSEYNPLVELVPATAALLQQTELFTPGEGLQLLEWEGHRLAALVCYEDILPDYVNSLVSATNPELLVTVTNDAWFGDSAEPGIHLAESRLRAIEHRRYLVRAANSGLSGVVDPTGAVSELAPSFTADHRVVTVGWLRGRTVYETIGDLPWWLTAGASFAAAFVRRPRRLRVGNS
jgi:apolipoprotein N-acyltransferase